MPIVFEVKTYCHNHNQTATRISTVYYRKLNELRFTVVYGSNFISVSVSEKKKFLKFNSVLR